MAGFSFFVPETGPTCPKHSRKWSIPTPVRTFGSVRDLARPLAGRSVFGSRAALALRQLAARLCLATVSLARASRATRGQGQMSRHVLFEDPCSPQFPLPQGNMPGRCRTTCQTAAFDATNTRGWRLVFVRLSPHPWHYQPHLKHWHPLGTWACMINMSQFCAESGGGAELEAGLGWVLGLELAGGARSPSPNLLDPPKPTPNPHRT